ncbi:MAG TPA: WecB/TagA/CpsF family glycosyltransferase [bacterium]|nr:WecB/TagA/CpsF family glycosyltransferase [bacterium]
MSRYPAEAGIDPSVRKFGSGSDDSWAPSVSLLGMQIHRVDLEGAVAAVFAALDAGRRGYVVTPNAQHVVLWHRDPAFRAACDRAALRLADGMSLVWASRLFDCPLPGRAAGADLLPAVCEVAATRGASVFLCGGRGGVAQRAAGILGQRYPGLRIVGAYTPAGRFRPAGETAEDAVRAVNRARPDILFVGLGAPTQEIWVHEQWNRLNVRAAVCCGAAIDYAAGTRRRAPGWMRRAGLEWLWRFAGEPRRLWHRYLVLNAVFLGICVTEWRRLRAEGTRGSSR